MTLNVISFILPLGADGQRNPPAAEPFNDSHLFSCGPPGWAVVLPSSRGFSGPLFFGGRNVFQLQGEEYESLMFEIFVYVLVRADEHYLSRCLIGRSSRHFRSFSPVGSPMRNSSRPMKWTAALCLMTPSARTPISANLRRERMIFPRCDGFLAIRYRAPMERT